MIFYLKVIPVIIGATGTIPKLFRKYPIGMMGKHIRELQKAAILDIAHLLRKVLMTKYTTFSMGNNITCSIHCLYKMAATLHTLVTWLISSMQL
jgi:hypothetical protein